MRLQIFSALAVLGVVGCVTEGGQAPANPAPAPVAAAPESAPAAAPDASALTNASAMGMLANGIPYCEYHGPNGELIGTDGQGAYQGSWSASGSQACYTITSRGQSTACLDVTIQGEQATFFYNGQPAATATLVSGNSCNPA
jgi:hypothetical protein